MSVGRDNMLREIRGHDPRVRPLAGAARHSYTRKYDPPMLRAKKRSRFHKLRKALRSGLCRQMILLLVVGIGVGIFFLFPRKPHYDIRQIQVSAPVPDDQGNLSLEMVAQVLVKSDNYIDYSLDDVAVEIALGSETLGTGHSGRVTVAKHGAAILPVRIELKLNTQDQKSSGYAIASDCGYLPQDPRPKGNATFEVEYAIKTHLAALERLGWVPLSEGHHRIACGPPPVGPAEPPAARNDAGAGNSTRADAPARGGSNRAGPSAGGVVARMPVNGTQRESLVNRTQSD